MSEDPTDDLSDEQLSDSAEPRTRRGLWPMVLVTAATFLAIVGLFSTWVRVQAMETDAWVELTDQMLDEPEIQEALAAYLVDELYSQVDIPSEMETRLPDGFEGLARPVSSALRGPATTGVERLLASEQFQRLWITTNRTAHEKWVAILRDETRPGVSTTDGTLALEMGVLLKLIGADFGLSDGALDRIPEDAGRITILESEELAAAQRTVQVLDFLGWFLFLLVVGLYAAAVYISPPERRYRTLRNVGLSLMIGSVIVMLARILAVRTSIELIVADPGTRRVASVAGYVATATIRQMAWSGLVYGLIIAAFATLLGEHRWAKATRRALAPALNSSVAAVAGGTIALLLLLAWWSPGRMFSSFVTATTLVLLIIGAVATLRRSTVREHPTATTADVNTTLVNTMSTVGVPRNGKGTQDEMVDQLEALRDLHRDGDLADDEYQRAKQQVLDHG